MIRVSKGREEIKGDLEKWKQHEQRHRDGKEKHRSFLEKR